MKIEKIAVLGGGLMGRGIAHTFSRFGYQVNVYEPFDSVREQVKDKCRAELEFFVEEGYITASDRDKALDNLHMFADLKEAVEDADYVLEACPEKIELKQSLFAQLEEYTKQTCILSTNTSSLQLKDITADLKEETKARSMVCHWYNPAYLIPIAELSKFGNMNDEMFDAVYELYVSCEKKPVRIMKDVPGMVANRILHALARECFHLLDEGVTEIEDLDNALKFGPCFRNATTGMVEVADMGGLDVWLAAEDNLFPHLCNDSKASESMRKQVEAGRLGIKTGAGFNEYRKEDGEKIQKEFFRRLLTQLIASKNY